MKYQDQGVSKAFLINFSKVKFIHQHFNGFGIFLIGHSGLFQCFSF